MLQLDESGQKLYKLLKSPSEGERTKDDKGLNELNEAFVLSARGSLNKGVVIVLTRPLVFYTPLPTCFLLQESFNVTILLNTSFSGLESTGSTKK